jgi:hypothetical protein
MNWVADLAVAHVRHDRPDEPPPVPPHRDLQRMRRDLDRDAATLVH